jgi:hypothetical protein
MKAYVITTGAVFGLITLAHIVRMIMEGAHVARDPIYILLTVIAAGFCLWSWRVLTLLRRA